MLPLTVKNNGVSDMNGGSDQAAAKVLTKDEARRIAANIVKLPALRKQRRVQYG
jgi:hypothetical protein